MALPDILAALQAAAASGTVDANTAPNVGAVLAKFAVPSFAITGGDARLAGNTAVLTAATRYRGAAWAFTLTGEFVNDANRFTLQLQGNQGVGRWTIGTSFAALPPSHVANPQAPQLAATRASVLVPLIVNEPGLYATSDAGPAVLALTGSSRYVG